MFTVTLNENLKTQYPTDDVLKYYRTAASSLFQPVLDRRTAPPVQSDGYLYHTGYIRYLEFCWQYHIPAVITPDIIWHIVLCEIAYQVKKDPNQFAKLFTTTPEQKHWIIIPTDDPAIIDMDLITEALKHCVPTNAEAFFPEFSTSVPASKLAFQVAFAEMVSPYYDYGTYCCGIPKIKMMGTTEDWVKVITHLVKLSGVFVAHSEIMDYLSQCIKRVAVILKPDVEIWSTMVSLKPCGSGSQYLISGWIMEFIMSAKPGTQLEGMPTHISTMNWECMSTNQKFRLNCGITRSIVVDGFLEPEFNSICWEITPKIGETMARQEESQRLRDEEMKSYIERARKSNEQWSAI